MAKLEKLVNTSKLEGYYSPKMRRNRDAESRETWLKKRYIDIHARKFIFNFGPRDCLTDQGCGLITLLLYPSHVFLIMP
jgi:hypothetical protein